MDERYEAVEDVVADAIRAHGKKLGALMPVLHAIQEELDCIPPEAVPHIARRLDRSRAEVQGVIDFYHDFRMQPRGRHTVQLCRAEACQAMGARDLEQHAAARLGAAMGETSADRQFTLEPVYCLGNCACAPSIRLDDELHARVTAERFDELIDQLEVRS
jgi:formate dehydrogenase subunit gamma